MAGIEPKMLSTMRVYDILQKYSDENHPMTHADIADKLEAVYGIKLERKAIARKITALKEVGYDIESGRKGSYIKDRVFDDSELHFLIDIVRGNRSVNPRYTDDLIEKLCGLTNVYFKPRISKTTTLGTTQKGDNPELFLNIDYIYEAMTKEKQIRYEYNLYGIDKKLHKSSVQIVSPYQLLFHQQGYYLMCYSESHGNISFHKIDHMTKMEILDAPLTPITKIKGYEKGLPPDYYTAARPYMFSDNPERIEMLVSNDTYVINQLVEWFGKNIAIKPYEEDPDLLEVSLKASPRAMRLWALQYADHVEIQSPPELRDSVMQSLEFALKRYYGEY